MRFLERDTKNLLKANGIQVTDCSSFKESDDIASHLAGFSGECFFLRSFVYERGKERFGDPIYVSNHKELKEKAEKIFLNGFTHLSSERKIPVTKVLVEEAIEYKMMFYISVFFDATKAQTVFLVSKKKLTASDLVTGEESNHIAVSVNFSVGFTPFIARKLAYHLGMDNQSVKKIIKVLKKIYDFFLKFDLRVLGLGPVYLTSDSEIIISGAQMVMDNNSLFRHHEIIGFGSDINELQKLEFEAYKNNISYIMFNGNIGCLVNGTGLGLAVMDSIRMKGGNLASLAEIGASATIESVKNAISIMLKDDHVKIIFINFFGGMTKCDVVASGILKAIKDYQIDIPIVVKIEGIGQVPAKKLLKENDKIMLFDDRLKAVENVVEQARQLVGTN